MWWSLANERVITSNQATTFIQLAYSLFLICTVESPEYKGNSSSPGTSIHNELLVNLMYATVASCFACSRPTSVLCRVIMKRYFWQILHVFKQWSIWTPHTAQHCFWHYASQSLLGNSAWVRENSHSSPLALTTAETITHSFNNLYWEVFLSFQYSCPNGILRAIFAEPERKKNVLNYLFPKVLALPDCFFFSLPPPTSLSLPSTPLGFGWMLSLSPNTVFLLATQQVSLFDHIIFIDSCDGLL